MASELRIRMDAVLESLLDTLAERHGRSPEEEAAQLLARALQQVAQAGVDLDHPEAAGAPPGRREH